MQLFESACRHVRSPSCLLMYNMSRLTSLFFIGLVETRVDVLVMKQKRASSIQWDIWYDGRTGHSMSLFTAVLYASQSPCHEL